MKEILKHLVDSTWPKPNFLGSMFFSGGLIFIIIKYNFVQPFLWLTAVRSADTLGKYFDNQKLIRWILD